MRFLIGMVTGAALAAGAYYFPQTREHASNLWAVAKQEMILVNPGKTFIEEQGETNETFTQADSISLTSPGNYLPSPTADFESAIDTRLQTSPDTHPSTSEAQRFTDDEDSTPKSDEGTFQAAWIPFRSEVSARGFSSRLSQQVPTNFKVIKTGPGSYEVGFLYKSESERVKILDSISHLTGFKLRPITEQSTGFALNDTRAAGQ